MGINWTLLKKQKQVRYIFFISVLFVPCTLWAQLQLPVKHGKGELTFRQITPANVQHDFRKEMKGVHPRLFYTQTTIQRIKKLSQANDPFVQMYIRNARQNADRILNEPLLDYHLDDAKLRIPSIHKFATQAPDLIFMYQLTGDVEYAERCYRQLDLICDYPDWGADRHFLDTGIGAFAFAFVYDGLYHYMTAAQREKLEVGVTRHALEKGKYQIEQQGGVWKWYLANNNWNGICNSGLVTAALAMYEENPVFMSELIASAVNCLPYYLVEFEPDGQSEEGLMYWSYGMMYTDLGFESMKNVLGSTFGMADTPGLRKSGWFPFLMAGPVTSLNIGDDPLRFSLDGSFFWYAHHYNDAALAKLHFELCLKNNRCQWQDIYFYDPELIACASSTSVSLDNIIQGIDLFSIRENWNSEDAMFIAMHGGANNANHGHLDAGSFYIQMLGEVFACGNLGGDNYTYPGYFSKQTLPGYQDPVSNQQEPGRWHFYRLRTEGKNCLIVDPTIRPEQKESGIAVFKRSNNKKQKSSYTIDLTDCYERDLHFYERTIGMDRKKKQMFVQDHLKCRKNDSYIWWLMHTMADIALEEKGRVAILEVNGKRMKAEIEAPIGATFQILPASYLLEEAFPMTRNTENKGFRRLAVELAKVETVDLKVVFSPY